MNSLFAGEKAEWEQNKKKCGVAELYKLRDRWPYFSTFFPFSPPSFVVITVSCPTVT